MERLPDPSPAIAVASHRPTVVNVYCSTNCGGASSATAFSAAFFFFLAVLGFAEVLRSFWNDATSLASPKARSLKMSELFKVSQSNYDKD